MNRKVQLIPMLFSRYGRRFTNQPLPKAFRRMRAKDCYHNAFRLLSRDPASLTYCEGLIDPAIIETHAWVVDAEGNVIDPTWKFDASREYVGIPFRSDYVFRTVLELGMHDSLLWFGLAELPAARLRTAIAPRFGRGITARRKGSE